VPAGRASGLGRLSRFGAGEDGGEVGCVRGVGADDEDFVACPQGGVGGTRRQLPVAE
jgi:hypothetical protein